MKTDNPTFNSFYSQYYHLVYGYVRKRIGNDADTEDLTADIFLACYKAIDSYDSAKASVRTWLFVIVNNKLKNYYRDKKPQADSEKVAEEDWGVQGPSIMLRSMALEDSRRQIAQALKNLPEQHRQIVVGRFFEELSTADLARRMQMSEGNVRVILHRSLKKMKQYVQ